MKAYNILNMGAKKNTGNGYFYNWYAVSNANFAPTDWKVPDKSEFDNLKTYLTNNGYSGAEGGALKQTGFEHWDSPNSGAVDTFGFSAFGSGYRRNDGYFYDLKISCALWFKTLSGLNPGRTQLLYYLTTMDISYFTDEIFKKYGLVVRLIYTGAGTPPSTITDYDDNVYDVIQIGTQYWLKQNWKCTHLNDGTPIPNVTDDTAWAALTTMAYCAYNNDESYV